ncbi:uncharacterized protein SCHCODRAFT_02641792 [Schizophyllum commune H4-8]|uniref:uncharacterized protein n=1 Tax=Schizophyllum commune (strain H4-8 / FGSC 9210) TaxID=578458 RepID=UPI00215E30E4|nr:uncharacterized protein SCHCODRAFT_02641792 [Schizophyllum commune H4-8]KAI5886454.1 hypothetical protein SCHCODRAFT_02641792 [Schizophyllum commune H4-8]
MDSNSAVEATDIQVDELSRMGPLPPYLLQPAMYSSVEDPMKRRICSPLLIGSHCTT